MQQHTTTPTQPTTTSVPPDQQQELADAQDRTDYLKHKWDVALNKATFGTKADALVERATWIEYQTARQTELALYPPKPVEYMDWVSKAQHYGRQLGRLRLLPPLTIHDAYDLETAQASA